jgi:hypothetical protein
MTSKREPARLNRDSLVQLIQVSMSGDQNLLRGPLMHQSVSQGVSTLGVTFWPEVIS